MTMKKIVVIFGLLFVAAISGFAASKASLLIESMIEMELANWQTTEERAEEIERVFDMWCEKGRDVEILSKEILSDQYERAFIEATRDRPEVRRLILAIGSHESSWFALRGRNTNADGSTDHGVLMINSHNIKNPYFMDLYFPKETYGSWEVDLMVTGVNFFTYLYQQYWDDAVIVYNMGESKYKYKSVPQVVSNAYRMRVNRFYRQQELSLFKIHNDLRADAAELVDAMYCMRIRDDVSRGFYKVSNIKPAEEKTPEFIKTNRSKRLQTPHFYDNRQIYEDPDFDEYDLPDIFPTPETVIIIPSEIEGLLALANFLRNHMVA
jgi:hypothetical protein